MANYLTTRVPIRAATRVALFMTCLALAMNFCVGCGTTREKLATEQMLLSDAVDRAVARIDFSVLRGQKVYLDTQYLRTMKVTHVVNADYIISALRQQMLGAGCLLQEERETAEYIAEARVGVLGTNGHDVNYGIPASGSGIAAAASAVGGSILPAFPEISFARQADDSGTAKVAVFAYRRDNKNPVWQSGTSVARSTSNSRWILGAGPFETGTIHEPTDFTGEDRNSSPLRGAPREVLTAEDSVYRSPALWDRTLQEQMLNDSVPKELLANRPEIPKGIAKSEGEKSGEAATAPSTNEKTKPADIPAGSDTNSTASPPATKP